MSRNKLFILVLSLLIISAISYNYFKNSLSVLEYSFPDLKKNVRQSFLFSKNNDSKNRHVIISNEILANTNANSKYFNFNITNIQGSHSLFSEILNYIFRDLTIKNHTFYTMGGPYMGPRDFIFYFYHALSQPETKTIIFSNDFKNINPSHKTDLAATLEAIHLLQKISEKHSELSSQSIKIANYFKHGDDYDLALRLYSEDWKKMLDPVSYTLPRYDKEGQNSYSWDGSKKSEEKIKKRIQLKLRKPIWPTQYLSEIITNSNLRSKNNKDIEHTNKEIDYKINSDINNIRGYYLSSDLRAPILTPKKLKIKNRDIDFYIEWIDFISHYLYLNKINFIYYLPPSLELNQELIQTENYMKLKDRIKTVLDKYNFHFIDHSHLPLITPSDLMIEENENYKLGWKLNTLGKIKAAYYLLEDLMKNKILFTEYYNTNFNNWKNIYPNQNYESPRIDISELIDKKMYLMYYKWYFSKLDKISSQTKVDNLSLRNYFNENLQATIKENLLLKYTGVPFLKYKCDDPNLCEQPK
ncbi:MAG: hypothetical protein H6625_05700 [Bdellovibrionaceae bacterium]|nr:hypothetical protein [Pseudobdellovibrionaceae bacterium]